MFQKKSVFLTFIEGYLAGFQDWFSRMFIFELLAEFLDTPCQEVQDCPGIINFLAWVPSFSPGYVTRVILNFSKLKSHHNRIVHVIDRFFVLDEQDVMHGIFNKKVTRHSCVIFSLFALIAKNFLIKKDKEISNFFLVCKNQKKRQLFDF